MTVIISTVLVVLVAVVLWHIFMKAKPLPSPETIESITIYFNETFGDDESHHDDPKEFTVTDRSEISHLRELTGDIPISKIPLLNSDTMDSGNNWIINIPLRNDTILYLHVDRYRINGRVGESSKLYQYLREHYT